MSSTPPELTTTSYAILGLLAIKPWSTYELAKQMQRDLHFVWPRAESNLYAEPKKLIAHGLARAESRPHGRRRRTVYSITPDGERALTAWLTAPAAEPRWESESLVKLMFATHGSRDQLLEHLRQAREHAISRWRAVETIFRPYLHGGDPFPERTKVNVLAALLVLELARDEAAWADRAIAEVEQWKTTNGAKDRKRLLAALAAELGADPAGSA